MRWLQLTLTFLLTIGSAADAASISNIRVRRDDSPLTDGRQFRPPPGPDGVKFNIPAKTLWYGYLKKNGDKKIDNEKGDGFKEPDMGFGDDAKGVGDYELMLRLKGFPNSKQIIRFTVRAAAPLCVFNPQPPDFQEAETGSTVTFPAAATNVARWQWFFNGSPIPGATSATLTLSNVTKANEGTYNAEAYNADGKGTRSDNADLEVIAPPVEFTIQPPPTPEVPPGSTVTFSAAANNAVRWQWFFKDSPISGATSATLTLNNVTKANDGTYYAEAYNADDVAERSDDAELAVVAPACVFTLQPPQNREVPPGSTVTFSAAANNAVRWQWFFKDSPISGATSATLTLNNVTKVNDGTYYAEAYNADDVAERSDDAELAVVAPACVFTLQPPQNREVPPGSTVTFSAAANNAVRWQWFFKDSPISGATSATLTLNNVTKVNDGTYYAEAYNADDVAERSDDSELAVVAPPKILTQPEDVTVRSGDPFELLTEVDDSKAAFQWRKEGVVLPGETEATLSRDEATDADKGSYICVVTNKAGTVTSQTAKVSVKSKLPEFTKHPKDHQEVREGETVTFEAAADNAVRLQWYFNGSAIVGATKNTLTLKSVTKANEGEYIAGAFNADGEEARSEPATLTIIALPKIITQPQDVTVAPGEPFALTISVDDSEATFQWKKDGIVLAGETTDTLSREQATREDEDSYVCVVTNAAGSVNSQPAKVSFTIVEPKPGKYTGLFYQADEVRPESSGCIALTVTKEGRFTGSVQLGSVKYSFTSQFTAEGSAEFQAKTKTKGVEPLRITISPDGENRFQGSVSSADWESEVVMERSPYGAKSPSPLAGSYTVLLQPDDANPEAPAAYGFLTLKVNKDGSVSASGKLADGSAASAKSTVGEEGNVALYLPLYKGKGLALGWITVSDDSVSGPLSWMKPAASSGAFPDGFATTTETLGAPYQPTEAILPDGAVMIISGANLNEELSIPLKIGPKNKITPGRAGVTLKIAANGSFTGSFRHPATSKPITFAGALYQPEQTGFGAYQAAGQTGEIYLGSPVEEPADGEIEAAPAISSKK